MPRELLPGDRLLERRFGFNNRAAMIYCLSPMFSFRAADAVSIYFIGFAMIDDDGDFGHDMLLHAVASLSSRRRHFIP